jgi:UrcA family protein
MLLSRTLVCLALAAAGTFPAAAASPARLPVGAPLTVSTSDLNLTTVDGRARLDSRIARAADRLCAPPYPGIQTAEVRTAYQACVAETIAAAAPMREAAILAQRQQAYQTAAVTP